VLVSVLLPPLVLMLSSKMVTDVETALKIATHVQVLLLVISVVVVYSGIPLVLLASVLLMVLIKKIPPAYLVKRLMKTVLLVRLINSVPHAKMAMLGILKLTNVLLMLVVSANIDLLMMSTVEVASITVMLVKMPQPVLPVLVT